MHGLACSCPGAGADLSGGRSRSGSGQPCGAATALCPARRRRRALPRQSLSRFSWPSLSLPRRCPAGRPRHQRPAGDRGASRHSRRADAAQHALFRRALLRRAQGRRRGGLLQSRCWPSARSSSRSPTAGSRSWRPSISAPCSASSPGCSSDDPIRHVVVCRMSCILPIAEAAAVQRPAAQRGGQGARPTSDTSGSSS